MVLVAYCNATNALFAHAVLRKGAESEGYAVEQLKQDALWLGHSKFTNRGDNEPSLVQVIDRPLAALQFAGVELAVAEGSVQLRCADQWRGRKSGEADQGSVPYQAIGS